MTASEERADAAEHRRQCREQRQAIRREWERDLAGPPPFRVTLAQARAKWPEWEVVQDERRADARRAATEKAGVVVARLLTDIHLPKLPDPTETVAYALDLECGHEDFLLDKQDADAEPTVERAPCPIFWKCQLNGGRTVVRYLAPGEPRAADAAWGLTRWSVTLACGHHSQVWQADDGQSRVGDFVLCRACAPGDPEADVEIVAVRERLPDLMVQDWTIELSCGHMGSDYRIPVGSKDDPAAYRVQNPTRRGHRCLDRACGERAVRGVRRLGVIGKIHAPKPEPAPPLDPVAQAAKEMQVRLTKEQRQALIRRLQDDDQ